MTTTIKALRWGRFGALFLMLVGMAFGAETHQQRVAITEVLFNPRTGNIEVSHRFFLHDAEHAVRALFTADADIIRSEATQQAFADYVTSTFSIQQADGEPLELTLLGHELERQYFWVYQEVPVPDGLESIILQHQSLIGLWPDQLNTVNVERGGEVQTVTFTGDSQPGVVSLRPQ